MSCDLRGLNLATVLEEEAADIATDRRAELVRQASREIIRLVRENRSLVDALQSCHTGQGDPGMQEGLGRQRRRLLAINDIVETTRMILNV